MSPERPLTASIYLRLSSPDEEDRTGFETQEAQSRAHAERLGATVVDVHKDDGFSGVLRRRPGFLAWLADGRTGRADLLIAWKSDRVSRGGLGGVAPLVDLVNGIDPETGLPARGPRPRLLTVVDAVDSALLGWEAIFGIHASTAKGERDATSARMLAHRAANRAAGRAVGGRRPWAFETVPNPHGPGSVRRPTPAHADAVRYALDHLREGGSIGGVASEWALRGLAPKGSRKGRERDGDGYVQAWTTGGVRRILANPNLYGATPHHGDVLRNEDGTVRVDPEQAILSRAEWLELQNLLDGRATKRNNPSAEPALLAGILRCASCGRVMYPHRPGSGRVSTYRCRGGALCPRPVSVRMADAEAVIENGFRATIGPRPYTPRRAQPAPSLDEVLAVREALDKVEAVLSDDLPDDEALRVLRQRRDLRLRLAVLQDQTAQAQAEPDVVARTFEEQYDACETVLERNRLLDLAFDRVTVEPGKRGTFDASRIVIGSDDVRDFI